MNDLGTQWLPRQFNKNYDRLGEEAWSHTERSARSQFKIRLIVPLLCGVSSTSDANWPQ